MVLFLPKKQACGKSPQNQGFIVIYTPLVQVLPDTWNGYGDIIKSSRNIKILCD